MSTATAAVETVAQFLARRADHGGHLGSIEVVEIEKLRIDPFYQRDLIQKLVDEIAGSYDPLTAGVVLVSRRKSGDMYIVDGQHKTAGAKQAGHTTVLALVVDGLTQKDEAALRLAANVKRADSALEKFRAKLAAGEGDARAIKAIVEQFDVEINRSPVSHKGINSVGSLEYVFSLDKTGILLTRTLEVIRDAWGAPEGDHAYSPLIKGIAYFLDRHAGGFDRNRLIERIQTDGATAIRRMAMNHKVVLGGSTWLNVYRAVVESYNYRLSDAQKLEWKTSGWTKRSPDSMGWES